MIIEQVVYSSKGRELNYPATIIEKALSVYIREPMTEDQVKKEFRDSYPALLPAWIPSVKFKPKCGPGKTVRRMLREEMRLARIRIARGYQIPQTMIFPVVKAGEKLSKGDPVEVIKGKAYKSRPTKESGKVKSMEGGGVSFHLDPSNDHR